MNVIADPTNLAPLWARVRAIFARAAGALGGAATIAAHTTLARRRRREIVGWIALLEHLVRKLLFAEAARVPREPEPSRSAGLQAGPSTSPAAQASVQPRSRRTIDPTAPKTWPVRFSYAPPRDPAGAREARSPRLQARAPNKEERPLRLARRFEALRRVLQNPQPYALRLAHRLRRLARRLPETLMRYALAPARTNWVDPADPLAGLHCSGAALAGGAAHSDTS
ncbi:MAG TPA: hypothetical protein VEA80_16710 [Vitreimonas sp.]|uniref:hypothetical protein n=1 Tax=Vitreimonas sp. TaxID=3069702 RepID=UPI002D71EF61|nr:hypothetical protein [Vitreimonas sp.]HYD89121.1 hypothetical protein [Vitreimonas sp.]